VDVLVTTRLHGLALALKNAVPVLAVDPMGDGAKILKQAKTVGWPLAFPADTMTDRQLWDAFDYCLTNEARRQAAACGAHAKQTLSTIQQEFLEAFQ
jgi:polysaccharide pyruvyl transferase WcaK-like protein